MLSLGLHAFRRHGPEFAIQVELRPLRVDGFRNPRGGKNHELQRLGRKTFPAAPFAHKGGHPIRGTLLPGLFIPVAEKSHLIVPIGQWVLREACRQAQAWSDSGLVLDQVAVNVSAVEFQSKGFLENITAIFDETGFDPHRIELELTESVLMRNAESTAVLLNEIKAMGVRLAIDDFGTGYSSLSYLSRFPIDTLKIDQSFVRKTTNDPSGKTIVSAMINLGKSLNQRVVAEGVETAEELAFLQLHNCDEGQGYHFCRPVCADEFASELAAGLPKRTMEIATMRLA